MAQFMDYVVDSVKNGWTETAQATAAVATATHAAAAGRHHVLKRVEASYSASTTSGELTVSFGSTVVARKHIHGAGHIEFPILGYENPDANEAVSAELAAGGGGIVGDVTLHGYSTGARA